MSKYPWQIKDTFIALPTIERAQTAVEAILIQAIHHARSKSKKVVPGTKISVQSILPLMDATSISVSSSLSAHLSPPSPEAQIGDAESDRKEKELKNELKQLRTSKTKQSQIISSNKTEIQLLKTTVEKLTEDNKKLKNQINETETSMRKMKSDKSKLEADLAKAETDKSKIEGQQTRNDTEV